MVRPGLAASHVADDARIVIEESQVISAFGILREAFGMFDYGRSRGVLPLRALAVLGEYALPGADVAPIANHATAATAAYGADKVEIDQAVAVALPPIRGDAW